MKRLTNECQNLSNLKSKIFKNWLGWSWQNLSQEGPLPPVQVRPLPAMWTHLANKKPGFTEQKNLHFAFKQWFIYHSQNKEGRRLRAEHTKRNESSPALKDIMVGHVQSNYYATWGRASDERCLAEQSYKGSWRLNWSQLGILNLALISFTQEKGYQYCSSQGARPLSVVNIAIRDFLSYLRSHHTKTRNNQGIPRPN
jgi:hypothetical protein